MRHFLQGVLGFFAAAVVVLVVYGVISGIWDGGFYGGFRCGRYSIGCPGGEYRDDPSSYPGVPPRR